MKTLAKKMAKTERDALRAEGLLVSATPAVVDAALGAGAASKRAVVDGWNRRRGGYMEPLIAYRLLHEGEAEAVRSEAALAAFAAKCERLAGDVISACKNGDERWAMRLLYPDGTARAAAYMGEAIGDIKALVKNPQSIKARKRIRQLCTLVVETNS